MSRKSFNEAVEMNDLEILFASTKRACESIIYTRGISLPPHMDVEDVTQDAIIKLLKALESFDSTKSTANTFCESIINRLIVDHIRRASLERTHRDIFANLMEDGKGAKGVDLKEEGVPDSLKNRKIVNDSRSEDDYYMTEILLDTAKSLTERQQKVFVLRQKGYTREEIAKELKVSVRTVATDWSNVSKVLLDLIY